MRVVFPMLALAACGFGPGPASVATADAIAVDTGVDAPADAMTPSPFLLTGQRWLLPCVDDLGNHNCHVPAPQIQMITLPGTSAEHYMVNARIRGAMEQITYQNGLGATAVGWYVGGNTSDGGDNIYEMEVSSPPQHYYLNNGVAGCTCSKSYDYLVSFAIDGGATVKFTATGQDTLQWGNYDSTFTPITFPGVVTTPQPYNGQFAQLDMLAVSDL